MVRKLHTCTELQGVLSCEWSQVVSESKFNRPLKQTNLDMAQALCDLYKTILLLIDQDHHRQNVFNFFFRVNPRRNLDD